MMAILANVSLRADKKAARVRLRCDSVARQQKRTDEIDHQVAESGQRQGMAAGMIGVPEAQIDDGVAKAEINRTRRSHPEAHTLSGVRQEPSGSTS